MKQLRVLPPRARRAYSLALAILLSAHSACSDDANASPHRDAAAPHDASIDAAAQDAAPAPKDAALDAQLTDASAWPPDANGRDAGHAGDSEAGDASGGDASFAAVQAIFDDRCVICHDASKQYVPAYPALPLTDGASYDALVRKAATETCGGLLVDPGHPESSYLVHKTGDATPCDGDRMPRPFEVGVSVPLSAEQLATIDAWIAAGAPR